MGYVSGVLSLKAHPCSPRSGVYVVPLETPLFSTLSCPVVGMLHQARAPTLQQEMWDGADDFLQL